MTEQSDSITLGLNTTLADQGVVIEWNVIDKNLVNN
jgi:hypothetical protein